jgi:hypothetical protein
VEEMSNIFLILRDKSENFSKKDSLIHTIKENPPRKEEKTDKMTLGEETKSPKKSNPPIFRQLNESDHLGDLPDGEDLLYNAIFKSKKQEEKLKNEDDSGTSFVKIANRAKQKHNSIPNTSEFAKKLEEQGYSDSEAKSNEIYNFNMDAKPYNFRILPTKGIEYILKSSYEADKWNFIEFSNLEYIEVISEVNLPSSYKVMFNLKLKNKVNNKDKHKLIGENEAQFISFSKRMSSYFINDK